MWRWKRQAAAGPDFSQLHDSIALKILQAVKEESTSLLLDGGVVLHSRGAVERVCSRWRALALQMPAALTINLCELHEADLDAEEVLCEVLELLPLLAIRNVHRLTIGGCTAALAPRIPSLLAGALFPGLRRLLQACSGGEQPCVLLISPRPLPSTATMDLYFADLDLLYEQLALLASHLCAVPQPLQMLSLKAPILPDELLETIQDDVEPAGLAIALASGPKDSLWLPQLRKLSLRLLNRADDLCLEQGLPALLQLESLTLDLRPPDSMSTYMLPSLASLPRLRKLSTQGVMPLSAWQCHHLTSLSCRGMVYTLTPTAMQPGCPPLRQLLLEGSFASLASSFPAQFCTLSSLTSLALLGDISAKHSVALAQVGHFGQRLGSGTASALPAAFSQLSSLRQLVITNASLDRASMAALHRLSQLTALRLPNCGLQSLPWGHYLTGLRSLDISGNPALHQAIPFQVTAAEGLRALRVTLPGDCTIKECWEDMEFKLNSLRRLEVVSLDDALCECVDELEERLRGSFTFHLHLAPDDCCIAFEADPEINGMADFADSDDE